MIADASGRALGFALTPGQAHELPLAPLLLTLLSLIPAWIVADRGHASHAFRDLIWQLGARPAIPAKRNEAPVACPPWIYVNRNRVERLWSRLKEWRAVATRYEKTACCFMGVLCMAATMYLLIPGIGWGSPTGIDKALDATMGRLIQARDGSASRPHLALA